MSLTHLILRLEAPLMSFGGVSIDAWGATTAWPSASMLTGLIANSLGMDRVEGAALQALQDRLAYACLVLREGERLLDYQTAQLEKSDRGWTTHGMPEERAGGAETYKAPHIREREYWADRNVLVALRLEPEDTGPSVGSIAEALSAPARPLFIGRKSCLPAGPLSLGVVEASDCLDALGRTLQSEDVSPGETLVFAADPKVEMERFLSGKVCRIRVHGRRDFVSGVHAGEQTWWEGKVSLQGAV